MKPYFDSFATVAFLSARANDWLGTPFMPNARVKGAGVSCQKLVGAIYEECGVLAPGTVIPDGPMSWGNAHRAGESLIEPFVDALPNFEAVEGPFLPGDLIGFKIGGCVHHLGIVIWETRFIHAIMREGVQMRRIDDPSYGQRIGKHWRPIRL